MAHRSEESLTVDSLSVRKAAEQIGFAISDVDVGFYQGVVNGHLASVREFLAAHPDDNAQHAERITVSKGRRPTGEEDPLGAWLWRCEQRAPAAVGLLSGKTVSFKDNVAVRGMPITYGTGILDGLECDVDATVVARVLQAGATITGKNSFDGFTGAPSAGIPGDHRRPINPHDPGRMTGGSSSGCAVAVASGDVDIAFGGDQGGSIRVPAAWTGIVGLKPTFGLVSHWGIAYGSDPSIDATGPMARTVDDVAIALQAVAGRDGLDPRQGADVPVDIDVLSEVDNGAERLRIGLLDEGFTDPIDADVAESIVHAADVLAASGADVRRVSVPCHSDIGAIAALGLADGAWNVFRTGLFGAFAQTRYPEVLTVAVNEFWDRESSRLSPLWKMQYLAGDFSRRVFRGAAYARYHNLRSKFRAAYDEVLDDVDLLLLPTCGSTAPLLAGDASGHDHDSSAASTQASDAAGLSVIFEIMGAAARYTPQFSYTGHPALSVPCGRVGGLPVGMQLVGRFFGEATLLRAAKAFQNAVDWNALIAVDGRPA